MDKIKTTGYEDCAGLGKASGKAYSIGQLYTLAPLIESFPEGGICRGGWILITNGCFLLYRELSVFNLHYYQNFIFRKL